MIITGNSNVSSFRQKGLIASAEKERFEVFWVGALKIDQFENGHPAGGKVRELFRNDDGWKLLSIGIHDIYALCEAAGLGRLQESLETAFYRYCTAFQEFNAAGRFAWLVFPQPLHETSFPDMTCRDLLSIARAFNKRVEEWCHSQKIAVINPLRHIVGPDGEPYVGFLQKDGIHLNVQATKLYLDEIEAVTGVKLAFQPGPPPFEPENEPESFCSLLLSSLNIPFGRNMSPQGLEKTLVDFVTGLLLGKGLELDIDAETELIDSGLMDSLSLVETYTFAMNAIRMDLAFDVNLRDLNTIRKVCDFMMSKTDRTDEEKNGLSFTDFLTSLRGNFEDPAQRPAILEAEERIANMGNELTRAFIDNFSVVSGNMVCSYGVIYFWLALIAAAKNDLDTALQLLTQAGSAEQRFPFTPSHLEYYSGVWSKIVGKDQRLSDPEFSTACNNQRIIFPESKMAHQWLDGLKGLEIGPSSHNPFGLDTRNVGIVDSIYYEEQMRLTGMAAQLDFIAHADAIPVPDESEDFILSSHVIEHCPDMIRTLVEWYRIIRPGGYMFMIVPHRTAAPSDASRPLTKWEHFREDFLRGNTEHDEPDAGKFGHCHYHVFDCDLMQQYLQNIFGERLQLVATQPVDDKIGNGFTLVYRKTAKNSEMLHWEFRPQSPLVSAIVSTYNSERFMRGCLEDLTSQTLFAKGQMEIVVVDSASPQNEGDIVREFQGRHGKSITYIRTEIRETIYQAWNRGIKGARGRYVTNANTDDRLRVDALEVMARTLDSHPEKALVYGDVFVTCLPNQTFAEHVRCGYHLRPNYSTEIMLSGCHMGPQPMWRKELHDEIGWFDETFRSAGDYEFWCRVAQKHQMLHLSEFLGLYFENPEGICNSAMDVSRKETEEIFRRYAKSFPAPSRSFTINMQFRGTLEADKFVNIGMVTFNRLEFTIKSIDALLCFTDYPYVLTVIDNNSHDGTKDYLQNLKKKGIIKNLVLLDENAGIAKASNLAWSLEPDASFYLKLDNDIVIQKPGWLLPMVEVVNKLPNAGAVAYNFEPTSYPIQATNGCRVRIKPQGNLGGACILIPRKTREKLGFWCEDYGLYGEEDYDYGIRIQLAGLQNIYMEDEEMGIHLPGGRAAVIDMETYRAKDGVEEDMHAEYRKWKDESRRKTISSGILKQNLTSYENGSSSLFVRSSFVQEWRGNQIAPLQEALPMNIDTRQRLKIVVFSLEAKEFACARVRLITPLSALRDEFELIWGVNGLTVNTGSISQADIIVIQRGFPRQETTNLLDMIFESGKPVIYDLDDLLTDLPATNPHREEYETYRPYIISCLERASAVTVSTITLATALKSYNDNIVILPNLMDENILKIPADKSAEPIVIGYVGTPTHTADLDMITGALEKISQKYGSRVAFRFMGCATERIAALPGFSFIQFDAGYESYLKVLQEEKIDIGLVPLADNRFNRCKSNIKWLEYSACGIAGAYADLSPYNTCVRHGETGLLVEGSQNSWFTAIEELINDPIKRCKIAAQARSEVLASYTLSNFARLFLETYRQIAGFPASPGNVLSPIYSNSRMKAAHIPQMNVKNNEEQPMTASTRLQTTEQMISHDKTICMSIIIPLYNKAEYTKQCLDAIAVNTDQNLSYELILIDNASTDVTPGLLHSLSGEMTVITNKKNLGFAKACNQGAKLASGAYLVFLNNDTVPHPGWLDALLRGTKEADICGAKLLYPNGRVQHAGVAFNEQGIGYHIFNGFPADHPAVNRKRFMQSVTGACMLIENKLFQNLGGFDENFINGFEDVDLCLRAGEMGKKILYNSSSVLIHFEETSEGRKKYDQQNALYFLDRWKNKVLCDDNDFYGMEGYRKETQSDGKIILRQRALQKETRQQKNNVEFFPVGTKSSMSPAAKEKAASGRKYKETGNFDEAMEAFAQACKFGDTSVLADMGDCLANLGKFEGAIVYYQDALKHAADNTQAHIGIGVLNLLADKYSEAADAFSKALHYEPTNSKALCGIGMARNGKGFKNAGYDYFKKALDADPENQTALHELIKLSYELGTFTEAEKRLTTYLMYHPGDLDMLFSLAGILHKLARYDDARDSLECLLALSPAYAGGAELLALVLAKIHETSVNEVGKDAVSCNSHTAEKLAKLGRTKKEAGNYEEALEDFVKVRALGDESVLPEMGDCKANLGKLDEASDCYEECVKNAPEDTRALVGLGVINLLQGNHTKAVTWFNKTLKCDPFNTKALCGLGMVRNLQNKPKEALKCFSLALDTDPENLSALHEVVKCSYELNRFEEAEKYLQNYLMYHPGDLDMQFSLAGIYFKKGDYAATLENIENLLVFDPEYAGGTELLDKVYTRMGKTV